MPAVKDLAGTTLSHRYRLMGALAGGGMGTVYRAHDLLLDRAVAVKVLSSALATDPALVARFKQEARAAARLSHPHVVAVHDWGWQQPDTYYIVMELVSGSDLRDVLLQRERLPETDAAEIVAAVCDALQAAHDLGLVHRDVKPENVLIDRAGRVRVADFGIAAAVDAEGTMPGGAIPGTLRYLAPEQAAGREASPASDVWAAGALLFELVSGRAPDQGAGLELLRRRAVEPVALPSQVTGEIHPEVDRICERACAVHPSARYASAAEMAADLRRLAGTGTVTVGLAGLAGEVTGDARPFDMEPTTRLAARGAERRHRGRRRIAVAAGALLLVAVAATAVAALTAPGEVTVPNIVGLSDEQAARRLKELGLHAVVAGRARSWDHERGRIVAQEPSQGVLKEGSRIELIVSSGPPRIPLPALVGLPLDVAERRVAARASEVGAVRVRHDEAPEGIVIGQKPSPGMIAFGESVELVVSKGPRLVAVPDVTSLTKKEAVIVVREASLRPVVVEAYSDEVDVGGLIGTNPPAGTSVPEGERIEILVSVGPRYEEVKMPDVRGMSVDAATAKLEDLGLRVQVRQSCGGGGTIVADTDPISGTTIRENDLVVLFVC